MSGLWQDFRFAVRLLVKDKWFTLAAVTALSLGIGANNAVFTIVNAVILRGLPFDGADRIVALGTRDPRGRDASTSLKDSQDWQEASHSFKSLASILGTSFAVGDEDHAADALPGTYTPSNLFSIIGEKPVLGRAFAPDDDREGGLPVAVVSNSVWKTRYGGDPAAIGRTIRVNGVPVTVIGVMRDGFKFPFNTEIWMSDSFLAPALRNQGREIRNRMLIARLADGVSVGQAGAELATISARLAREYPDTNKDVSATVATFNDRVVGTPLKVIFWSLQGAVAFVLLIACGNVANLLLARASHRSREISVRVALGAGRARIVRQLLVESLLLAVLGGIVGLGLSIFGIRWFDAAVADAGKPYWMTFTLDPSVFAFFALVCILAGLLFGLAPALQVSQTNVLDVLKEGGRSGTGGVRARRWASALIIAQITLTLVLLSGAGLMMRSFMALYRQDLGMDTSRLLTAQLTMVTRKFPTAESRASFLRRLNERLATAGDVVAATTASNLPMGFGGERQLLLDGAAETDRPPLVTLLDVAPRYFETVGVTLLRGRAFDDADGMPGRENAIVNQRFASMYFAGQDPIGRRIRLTSQPATGPQIGWVTIVGVAPTVRQRDFDRPDPDPVVYVPHQGNTALGPNTAIILRGRGDPAGLTSVLRKELAALDPDLPLSNIRTMDSFLALLRWPARVFGIMFAVFAGIALALAAVGLYGVTAYSVTQRTQEIGIRMALGAERRQIRWLILRRGMAQLAFGLALGLAGAFGVGRVLKSSTLLYETSANDPTTMASIVVILALVSMAACLWPIRRASRLDPAVSLRLD